MFLKYNAIILGLLASMAHQGSLAQNATATALLEQGQFWQSKGNQTRAAESWIKLLLIDPNHPQALYGMALAEKESKRPLVAMEYLEKIKRLNPKDPAAALLEQDISLSRNEGESSLERARAYAKAGELDKAIGQYNIAMNGKQPQGPLALEYFSILGYSDNGFDLARQGLQVLEKKSPKDADVSLALGKLLISKERTRASGIKILSRLMGVPSVAVEAKENWQKALTWSGPIRSTASSAPVSPPPDPRATKASAVAKAAIARGDDVGARTALEDAMRIDNLNPWLRLELAQLYLKTGQTSEARGLVDGLLVSNPNLPDALYASAILAGDLQEWSDALAKLEKIPAKDRTPDMAALQKRAWVLERVSYATSLAKQDRKAGALLALMQTKPLIGSNLGLLGSVANAYVDAGEPATGLGMLRPVMMQSPRPSPSTLLQFAGVLLKTSQDVEAAGILRELQDVALNFSDKKSYDDLMFNYNVRQADSLRERADYANAYDRLMPLLAQRPESVAANASLARLYAAAGDSKIAINISKQLVQKNPDSTEILLGAAQVAVQVKDDDFADSVLQSALALAPNNSELVATVARIYRSRGKSAKAAELFARALAIQSAAVSEPLVVQSPIGNNPFRNASASNQFPVMGSEKVQITNSVFTHPSAYYQTGQVVGSAPQTGLVRGISTVAPSGFDAPTLSSLTTSYPRPGSPRTAQTATYGAKSGTTVTPLLAELDAIQQERSTEIVVSTQVRQRSGDAGTSKLLQIETPLEIRFPVNEGKMKIQITPIALKAGQVGADNLSQRKFGTYASGTGPVSETLEDQSASGIGWAAGYKTKGFEVDGGITPVGFIYKHFTGGVKLDGTFDSANSLAYSVNLSSRPVTDSLLSFAGTRDTTTGQTWGGVMATGPRFQLTKDFGGFGFTGAVSYHDLKGDNVASNSRTEIGAGAYVDITRQADYVLSSGINVMHMAYDKNLEGFTFGQGGYFSPQSYNAVSVPLNMSQRSDKLTYRVDAELGFRDYTSEASNYAPSIANSAVSSSGMFYKLAVGAQYQLASNWFLGGRFYTDNIASGNYRQVGANITLRYTFHPMTQALEMPVRPYVSAYGQ